MPIVKLEGEKKFTHPWVFQRFLQHDGPKPRNGSLVDLVDGDGKWVARGLYNGHARVSMRILTENPDEAIDQDFFERKIRTALAHRLETLKLAKVTNAFRIVHSEADGLSGLMIDLYNDLAVIEYYSSGMFQLREEIEGALLKVIGDITLYTSASESAQKQESFNVKRPKQPNPITIFENGLKFWVRPGSKHKTGFFLDQRENRRRLADFCPGKDVLDLCCNSGGFGVYAKTLGKANSVTSLDLDEEVLETAKENAALNHAEISYAHADLFVWLRDRIHGGAEQYDVVILDPSKQARSMVDVEEACKRYCDMNRLAMQVTKPGGVLLTCSCSGLVKEEEFLESLRRAAWQANRQMQIFAVTGAAADHPFLVNVPESRYLKAVWARIL